MHNSLLPRALHVWGNDMPDDRPFGPIFRSGAGHWGMCLSDSGWDPEFDWRENASWEVNLYPDDEGLKLELRVSDSNTEWYEEGLPAGEVRLDGDYPNPLAFAASIMDAATALMGSCEMKSADGCPKCHELGCVFKMFWDFRQGAKESGLDFEDFSWQVFADRFDEEAESEAMDEVFDAVYPPTEHQFVGGFKLAAFANEIAELFLESSLPATVDCRVRDDGGGSFWLHNKKYVLEVSRQGSKRLLLVSEVTFASDGKRVGHYLSYRADTFRSSFSILIEPGDGDATPIALGLHVANALHTAWLVEIAHDPGLEKSKEYRAFEAGFAKMLQEIRTSGRAEMQIAKDILKALRNHQI